MTLALGLSVALGTVVGTAWAFELPAASPEEQGLAIAMEADARDNGFVNFTAQMKMILSDRHGGESTRELRVKTLEVDGDGDKSLVIFDNPRDVSGTAFLTFSHKTGADDQWLYLPALKRVKRIASNNKSGPFMGSEFAYEDISSQEVEKYTYKFLREEELNGMNCYVIERYPVDKKSGYTRQIGWYDKEEFRIQKVDFYDRKDSLLKTLIYEDYALYADDFWRPSVMTVTNHQTGKGTVLEWNDYSFKVDGLSEKDFEKNSLKRAR
ncbi:MAG: outer membrane lipoprotein-sorting protein [Candidatus Eisenbacteria bacterium]|uniref:Outer membrane lipoprotein-sorting protein n=1 Tax=Eiseniibacteriota bacterium TaxID=2212470 RepID=A0A7Y2H112_UNCEI|nr:outer membrane lipoprotein-sorting protein [Candidatus Eisenbacteria bacterium]